MQSRITDECDLVLTWTWAERMELLGQIENIKQQMEINFAKYFTNDKGPELAGLERKEKS